MDVTSLDIKIIQSYLICCMFWFTNTDVVSDVYLPCAGDIDFDQFNVTEEQSIDHPTSDGFVTLYYSETGVTWCEAYRTCRNMSSYMFMISSQDIQDVMSNFNATNSSERAWLAGTRKIHGLNWTWVNDSLVDCDGDECNTLNVEDGEYGFIFLSMDTYSLHSSEILDSARGGYCESGTPTESGLTWYEKQLHCISENNHLATFEKALSATRLAGHTIGLQFRPWLWIRGDELQPGIYTSWAPGNRQPAGMADCLGIELNTTSRGAWNEHNCSDQLHYFLCEDTKMTLTTVGPPGHSTIGDVKSGTWHIPSETFTVTGEPDVTASMTYNVTFAASVNPSKNLLPVVIVFGVMVAILVAAFIGQHMFWRHRLKSTQLNASKENLEYEDTAETMAGLRCSPSRDLKPDLSIGQVGPYEQVTPLEQGDLDRDSSATGPVSYEQINLRSAAPTGSSPYTELNFNKIP